MIFYRDSPQFLTLSGITRKDSASLPLTTPQCYCSPFRVSEYFVRLFRPLPLKKEEVPSFPPTQLEFTTLSNPMSADIEREPKGAPTREVLQLYIIEFTGPDDPSHPHNWAIWRRVWVSFMLAIFNLVVTISSSIFGSAQKKVAEEFGVSGEVTVLGTSLFLVVCKMCLIWQPTG